MWTIFATLNIVTETDITGWICHSSHFQCLQTPAKQWKLKSKFHSDHDTLFYYEHSYWQIFPLCYIQKINTIHALSKPLNPTTKPQHQPTPFHSKPSILWISTDSLCEAHPTHRQPWSPHPFSYPTSAHIICFRPLGDISLWRGREKLFKLHKHNVARAPTGCWWWMATAQRKRARVFQEAMMEQDQMTDTAIHL